MDKFLPDASGLTSLPANDIEVTSRAIKDQFRIETPGFIDFKLEQFEVLNHHRAVNITNTFAIKNACGDSYLLYLNVDTDHTPAKGQKTVVTEQQAWALAYLKRDFGRVFIRTETIIDKIREIIFPIE